MEVVAESVAGIDVHQKQITVSVLLGRASQKPKKVSKRFDTTTSELKECGTWLLEQHVSLVLMESTGQYWRPVWQILGTFGFDQILCNPRIIKNIPGKKTDQKDSEWLAELARYGLVSASYVPPVDIQELRESTRLRKKITESMTATKNEIHNILQRSNIKLTSYVSDIFHGSGLKILNLLIDGVVINENTIARCMHGKMKSSPAQIEKALDGILTKNNRNLLMVNMSLIKSYDKAVEDLNSIIDVQLEKFSDLYCRLQGIPGISTRSAQIIIAEIGADVSPFPDAHHLASWAGLCPGNYESAGIKHGSSILHGNKYLKSALVTAAMGAKKSNNSYLQDFFWRLNSRMGAQKAIVAVAHKMLKIVYSMIESEKNYQEYKNDQRLESLIAKV